ncbi:MAG TPA: prenyltransferase/squalene oxidase repeat-containing protein [Anaerolineae bacterium]|nr:prenyltransferase/squalene oxidase repeat-containing protein [Anaerolineae bacterium]
MKRYKVTLMALLALALVLISGGAAWAASPDEAAAKALAWLKSQQNDDGGFGSGFGPGSAIGPTADAIIAITSGGQDVSTWTKSNAAPLDYLRAQAGAGQITLPGDLAKTILALIATRQDPRAFGGQDLLSDLESHFDSTTSLYSSSIFDQALAILALRSAGASVPDAAVAALLAAQTVDGGWAFTSATTAGAADSNTTSLAVQALVAVGRKDDTGRALDYFRRVQNADAGWTYQSPSAFGVDTDANSTALGVQAILAAGDSVANWSTGASDPIGALLALQNEDGSFSFNQVFPGPNALATLQAVPALYGNTLVQVNVVPATGTGTTSTPLLPEAGGVLDALPALALGLTLLAAGYTARRRVRVL